MVKIVDQLNEIGLEFVELDRLFRPENRRLRRLVFYSERDIYYRYYEAFIDEILAASPDIEICYISSHRHDPIFQSSHQRVKPYYIKYLLPTALARLDSKVIVMTAPDLNRGSIKRAPDPVTHVYIFHAISSTHKIYNLGAFDHYDSLLCVAKYQIDEIRKTEEVYGLKRKHLIECGYPLLEHIYRGFSNFKSNTFTSGTPKKTCLIAPTWGASSIMETCIEGLIDSFVGSDYTVWIKPHPESFKRNPTKLTALTRSVAKTKNIKFMENISSLDCLWQTDILITDHSSIAFEYSLGTERPTLFIDTPVRIDNPDWQKIDIEPVEQTYRDRLGVRLSPKQLNETIKTCEDLIKHKQEFQKRIPELRNRLVANWQESAKIGATYILELCAKP